MNNSPSETASFLATCVESLDDLARHRFTTDDATYMPCVKYTVNAFLNAFQAACVNVVPALPLARRGEPVRHVGVSGSSFHEIAFRIALKQFERIYLRLDPKAYLATLENGKRTEFERCNGTEFSVRQVVEDWSIIAEDLAKLFADQEPIDSRFLVAGIESETPRGDDTTVYVMASTIWKGRFSRYEDFRAFLESHPEIPTKQKGQRRLVHAVKCLEVLAKQDQAAFDRLDESERRGVVPDTVDTEQFLENTGRLFREVNARKKPKK